PDADLFLQALQRSGRQAVLITNAHRDSLSLKMERVQLRTWFQRLISSHDFGYPMEEQRIWHVLRAEVDINRTSTMYIDDSLGILRAARQFGIGQLLAVRQPDSRGERRDTEEFAAVEDYLSLVRDIEAGLPVEVREA